MAIPRPASDRMAIERATIAGITTCHLKNHNTDYKLPIMIVKPLLKVFHNLVMLTYMRLKTR